MAAAAAATGWQNCTVMTTCGFSGRVTTIHTFLTVVVEELKFKTKKTTTNQKMFIEDCVKFKKPNYSK